MNSVRVLQVLGRSAGGVGRHVAEVVANLDGRDDLVLDIAAPRDLKVELPKAAIELQIPNRFERGHFKAVRRLRELISAGGYSVVHAHGLRAGIDGAFAARRSGVAGIVTLHNLVRPETSGRLGSLLYRRAESAVLMLAGKVFAVSAEMEAELRGRAFSGGKIELLYIGAPEPKVDRSRAEVRLEIGISDGDPLVVSVARLVPQKALDVLIDAMEELPAATLAIVGDGFLRDEVEQHAAASKAADRIRFLGQREGVGDYLAAADVFALSSTWEARALAAQEAIVLGVPVVATNVGGMSELVKDGTSGRLVPPGDPRRLALAIADVLEDPEKGRRFAEEARRQLMQSYSPDRMFARLKEEYLRVGARAS